jgi:hypothetical protein
MTPVLRAVLAGRRRRAGRIPFPDHSAFDQLSRGHGWASALGAALALVLHSMTLLPGRSPWRYFYATLSFDFS